MRLFGGVAVLALLAPLGVCCGAARMRVVDAPLAPGSPGACAGVANHDGCLVPHEAAALVSVWRPYDAGAGLEWATDSVYFDGCRLYSRVSGELGIHPQPGCVQTVGEQNVTSYAARVVDGQLVVDTCAEQVVSYDPGSDTIGQIFAGWHGFYRRVLESELSWSEVELVHRCRSGMTRRVAD